MVKWEKDNDKEHEHRKREEKPERDRNRGNMIVRAELFVFSGTPKNLFFTKYIIFV